jgi:hypothetical protein
MKAMANNPYDDPELDELVGEEQINRSASTPWPDIGVDAYYGFAGDIVKAMDPYTESDPKAILLHLLVGFGNIISDGPHAMVGVEKHPARLNAVLVGATSTGRKTSSWRPIKEIFRRCDSPYTKDHVRTGLSTGEGIIYHLRDETEKDEGVTDKRLLAIEAEFSSMLKIMAREGNSLSGVLRQAWDDGNLSTLTRNSPLKATGAHFSVVGHTTKEELIRYLDATEKANGFANRILWCLVKRSKLLPDGEQIPEELLNDLSSRMSTVIKWARTDKVIRRDQEAAELWRAVYPKLSEGRPGMSGAVLNRAEAQTLRLSLIYALLDQSYVIRIEHLRAAIAVWEACEHSVLAIFGDRTGDPVADKILDSLKQTSELTREEIVQLFSRHRTDESDRALSMLERIGRIVKESKPTKGRPVTIYRLRYKL